MSPINLKPGKYPIDCPIKGDDGRTAIQAIYMVVNADGYFAEIIPLGGPEDGREILIPLSPALLQPSLGLSLNPGSLFLYQGCVEIPRPME